MTSWLRVLGLRVALLCALVATLVAAQIAAPRGTLPFALIDSFDRAFSLAYDAAERKVAALETTTTAPPRRDLGALLRELERMIIAEHDAATARLDAELVVAGSLSLERRNAALGCIERHLRSARRELARATDPRVCAEYQATCERLREIRDLV
jgi:hypothetical protein